MSSWSLYPSTHSLNTINPIREAVSNIVVPSDFPVPTYSLALGDPSKYPDFSANPVVIESALNTLQEGKGNGYTDSLGSIESRITLAREYSYENIHLTTNDVIIDIGGTGAIHTILSVFLNQGDNILMPSPGFPLYKTMSLNLGAEAFTYRLNPNENWQVDLQDLESKINARTKLIVVINPSNPCGSVYSKEHLLEILSIAQRHNVCVLADEVYHNMTYGKPFFPLGSLTDEVPVFTVGALSKIFLVPGWRCGWVLIYDKHDKCRLFREAIQKVKNMLLHPCPFIMQAIPNIYKNLPANYFTEVMLKVKERAEIVQKYVNETPALSLGLPEGSLYCMISIDFTNLDIKNSIVFAELLAKEQGVVVMPAEAFLSESGFRVVLCHPTYVIEECMKRIQNFSLIHTVSSN